MNLYDVANTSLASSGASSVTESKILLWSADGMSGVAVDGGGGSGSVFVNDGTANVGSKMSLFTLSSNFPLAQQFAFEVTMSNATVSNTLNVQLYDINVSLGIGTLTNTLTTANTVRSSKFSLTPGHAYGVSLWSTGGNVCYVIDASLIVFPS